jgi:hypothetical protein
MPLKDRLEYNKYMREYKRLHSEKMCEIERRRRMKRRNENKCIRCGSPLIEDEVGYCTWCKTMRKSPIIRGLV